MSTTITTDLKQRRERNRFRKLSILCLPAIFALVVVAFNNNTTSNSDSVRSERPTLLLAHMTGLTGEHISSPSLKLPVTASTGNPMPRQTLYFSVDKETSFGSGMTIANEDIATYEDNEPKLFFDGSDVGLAQYKINSLSVINSSEILLTFNETVNIAGIERPIHPTDIVRFIATELGDNTVGTFDLYFVGANVGLDTSGENIDAMDRLSDGRLVISTVSSFSVPLAEGNDEDLIVFTPTALGMATVGSWEFYLDGSDIEWSGQDVDGLAVDGDGNIYLSGNNNFTPAIGSVSKNDVIRFTPKSLGKITAGSYLSELVLDGSKLSLDARNIKGLDVCW